MRGKRQSVGSFSFRATCDSARTSAERASAPAMLYVRYSTKCECNAFDVPRRSRAKARDKHNSAAAHFLLNCSSADHLFQRGTRLYIYFFNSLCKFSSSLHPSSLLSLQLPRTLQKCKTRLRSQGNDCLLFYNAG